MFLLRFQNADETQEKENQIQTKKSKPTLIASSTPQRASKTASATSRPIPMLPVQNDGELLDELLTNANDDDDDDELDDEGSQDSDAVEGTDDDNNDQHTRQNLRRRLVKN